MAVLSINEIMEGSARSLSYSVQSGAAYQRKFRVITNAQTDGPVTAIQAVASKFGDRYTPSYNQNEWDQSAYITQVSCEGDGDDGLEWIITLSYSWYDALTAGGGEDQNPLHMPIEVTWDLRDHELVLERDIDGNPVLNTAGDPFDPPIVVDDPHLVMTVVRNEAKLNLAWVLQYRNAINSDSFAGFDPYYARVLNIQSRNQFHQKIGWYYQTTYQFEFLCPKLGDDSQGFRKRILNQGMRAISVVSGKQYHITLKGIPISSPMLLDQNGYLLPFQGTPYFLTVKAYPELEFAKFSFDPDALSGNRSGFPGHG